MNELDDSSREFEIRSKILKKEALRKTYIEFYSRFDDCLKRCPKNGVVLELGSGAGFLNRIIPRAITTDLISYSSVDLVMNALKMPFRKESVSAIFMLNTLHHIPDALKK